MAKKARADTRRLQMASGEMMEGEDIQVFPTSARKLSQADLRQTEPNFSKWNISRPKSIHAHARLHVFMSAYKYEEG